MGVPVSLNGVFRYKGRVSRKWTDDLVASQELSHVKGRGSCRSPDDLVASKE